MDELLAQVPQELQPRFREITTLTDKFCAEHLNDEYRDICRELAVVCCKADVPVESGKAASWAAGVIGAVAYVNFLTSDPSQQFHINPGELARGAGVSVATMNNKSRAIRDALDIDRMDPEFSIQQLNEKNLYIWLLRVNGMPLDIRTAPREAQEVAFNRGLIPYIPADGPPTTPIRHWQPAPPEPSQSAKKKAKAKKTGPPKLYTLDVHIISGPITEKFAKKNPSVVRTIEMRGDQTLDDLHEMIFDAFDRDDPHMYEFQFGKKPMDNKGPRYVMPEAAEDDFDEPAGLTTETTLDDLELKPKQCFWYWFDFGDDWHHRIDVKAIADAPGKGKYPRVTRRVGESPPQYIDWD